MNDIIKVYEGNSKVVTCTVTNDDGTAATLTGFDATITVTEKLDGADVLFSSTGVIVGNVITFTIDPADNAIPYGVYMYEITIESLTETISLLQGRYHVMESLVYQNPT